jgi:hypothetical protein
MKKHLMRVVNANFFSKFIKTSFVVLLLTAGTGAYAQVSPVALAGTEPANAAISYVTTTTDAILFDVKVTNAIGERFLIIVKDENGTIMYRGAYHDKDFKKRFMLPRTDASRITFQVKSDSGSTAESFEINTNTRVIEEVVVKKVI